MILIVSWLLECLLILLSVAFFTLFERKVIGLFHNRLGPNKVSFLGLLQPLLDAFKLLTKQNLSPFRANKFAYSLSPLMSLFMSLFVWIVIPSLYRFLSFPFSLFMFFTISSILVFGVLLGGWRANSKYSLIGRLRSIAQSVSYEAVFRTLIVLLSLIIIRYSIYRYLSSFSLIVLFLLPLWVICTLAETHRAPFDFRESESELVSGFNTEYSGLNFALVFLSEYAMLLFSCLLLSFVFIPFVSSRVFLLISFSLLVRFFFIWVRITFCRFRYDKLIHLSWKTILPVSLLLLILYLPIIVG